MKFVLPSNGPSSRMRRYHAGERAADVAIHVLGTIAGFIGAAVLLVLSVGSADVTIFLSVLAYSVGLMAMLALSAAYHWHGSSGQGDILWRLDHSAIFVMIAGTYTPFTICTLNGTVAIWLTASIWLVALAGVYVKLAYPRRYEWASVAVYLFMGLSVVAFVRPLLADLDRLTVILLVSGGILYSVGASIHRWHRLPYHDAIWHGAVLSAAGLHYGAILRAIVLPSLA